MKIFLSILLDYLVIASVIIVPYYIGLLADVLGGKDSLPMTRFSRWACGLSVIGFGAIVWLLYLWFRMEG